VSHKGVQTAADMFITLKRNNF